MAASQVLSQKSFCIITGGSRGIGRALAVAISAKISADSCLVLTGRSTDDLSETQRFVHVVAPGVEVRLVTADLSNQDTISSDHVKLTNDVNPSDYQHFLLINNAASLGDTMFIRQIDASKLAQLQQYCMLNITSTLLLTAHFLRTFPKREGIRRTVVNVTSLAAIQPISSCALYCMGKAARDMLFRTIAVEEPDVRILNYAPGPVDTTMFNEMREMSADQSVRDGMTSLVTSQKVLKPDQTASMLTRILEEDTFESGGHVDYFDIAQ